jgi:hypothetical protein
MLCSGHAAAIGIEFPNLLKTDHAVPEPCLQYAPTTSTITHTYRRWKSTWSQGRKTKRLRLALPLPGALAEPPPPLAAEASSSIPPWLPPPTRPTLRFPREARAVLILSIAEVMSLSRCRK